MTVMTVTVWERAYVVASATRFNGYGQAARLTLVGGGALFVATQYIAGGRDCEASPDLVALLGFTPRYAVCPPAKEAAHV